MPKESASLGHERGRGAPSAKGKPRSSESPNSPKREGVHLTPLGYAPELNHNFHGIFVSVLTCIIAGPTKPRAAIQTLANLSIPSGQC